MCVSSRTATGAASRPSAPTRLARRHTHLSVSWTAQDVSVLPKEDEISLVVPRAGAGSCSGFAACKSVRMWHGRALSVALPYAYVREEGSKHAARTTAEPR